MTKLRSRSASRLTKAGIAVGGFTSLLLAGTAIPAFAAVPGTLSVSSGPSGGGNTITLTASNAFSTASPVVEFQAVTSSSTACSTSYKAPVSVTAGTTTPFASTAGAVATPAAGATGGPTRLTTSKIVIPIPSGTSQPAVALVGSQTASKFYVCVYDGTSTTTSTLLASATYSIAAQPTLASQSATPPGVSPTSGPALGGNSITLTGTGFISGATTVTIGGTPATQVTVNTSGTIVTANVASHAPASNQIVAVTTTGGTANWTGYTFSNAVNVAPNTSTNTVNPTLDVTGAGFSTLTWATDLDTTGIVGPAATHSTGSRIVLTDNKWASTNATGFGSTGGSLFASISVYPVAQCGGILPISDGEVICVLDLKDPITYTATPTYALLAGAVPNGTYQLTVVNSDAATELLTASNNYSITASGSTFTVSPF
jgi:hypothetical protein